MIRYFYWAFSAILYLLLEPLRMEREDVIRPITELCERGLQWNLLPCSLYLPSSRSQPSSFRLDLNCSPVREKKEDASSCGITWTLYFFPSLHHRILLCELFTTLFLYSSVLCVLCQLPFWVPLTHFHSFSIPLPSDLKKKKNCVHTSIQTVEVNECTNISSLSE